MPVAAPSPTATPSAPRHERSSSTSWMLFSASITARIAAVRYQSESTLANRIRPIVPWSRMRVTE